MPIQINSLIFEYARLPSIMSLEKKMEPKNTYLLIKHLFSMVCKYYSLKGNPAGGILRRSNEVACKSNRQFFVNNDFFCQFYTSSY